MKEYRISPTTGLNLFDACPKCFWLLYNKKIQRPRGIFPSLPGGMDEVIKVYFDTFRGTEVGLPPEIVGNVRGQLFDDQNQLDTWRNWRAGLSWTQTMSIGSESVKVTLFGALDDCLQDGDTLIPLDYKTRGYPPKKGDSELYYQTQLDSYATLLSHNGFSVADVAFLVYYYPLKVEKKGKVTFAVEPVEVRTDVSRLENKLRDAVSLLLSDMPAHHAVCEFFDWSARIAEFD